MKHYLGGLNIDNIYVKYIQLTRLKKKIENNSTWKIGFIKMNELKITNVELF